MAGGGPASLAAPKRGGRRVAGGSTRVVIAALLGNAAIAAAKYVAAAVTGSSAMFAEAVHSTVDTGNQACCSSACSGRRGPRTRGTRSATGRRSTSGPSWWRSCSSASAPGSRSTRGSTSSRNPAAAQNVVWNYAGDRPRDRLRGRSLDRRLARVRPGPRQAAGAPRGPAIEGPGALHRALRGHGRAGRPRRGARRRLLRRTARLALGRRRRDAGDRRASSPPRRSCLPSRPRAC